MDNGAPAALSCNIETFVGRMSLVEKRKFRFLANAMVVVHYALKDYTRTADMEWDSPSQLSFDWKPVERQIFPDFLVIHGVNRLGATYPGYLLHPRTTSFLELHVAQLVKMDPPDKQGEVSEVLDQLHEFAVLTLYGDKRNDALKAIKTYRRVIG